MKPQGIGMFCPIAIAKISPTLPPNAAQERPAAWRQIASRTLLMSLALLVSSTVVAEDSVQDAADMAEVFIYGRESKNEALLKEISDPKQYEAMAEQRKEKNSKLNENVEVDKVEITDIDGDRATAKATFVKKHKKGDKRQADVHLRRVDGKWQVTSPPEAGSE